jgi:hypothetical protein
MAGSAPRLHAFCMTIQPNTSQRDLVRLSVLVCGERTGAKYRPAAKGTHSSANAEPWRGYAR